MARDPLVIRLREPQMSSPRRRGVSWVHIVGVGIGIIGFAVFVINVAGHFLGDDAPPGKDTSDLVGHVGLLMLLPTDEQPTIATVSNLDAVKDQVFFKNARIGDVVLMYPKAGRAILYSPTENMIIEVAPIVLDAE